MRNGSAVAAWAVGIVWAAAAVASTSGTKPRSEPAHGPAVNVVAMDVRAIAADGDAKDTARLLVLVVDDAGDPLDAVAVQVLAGGKEIASGESDARGRVLLRIEIAGAVTVRAVESGLVPSEARGVVLRKAGLTAVALPIADVASRPGK
jgi:hypothetical protein